MKKRTEMLLRTLIIFTALFNFIQADVEDVENVEALREEHKERLKPLYTRLQNLDTDIYNLKANDFTRGARIAKDSFESIVDKLMDDLTNQLPSCNSLHIWKIKQDLESMVTNNHPYACQEELDFITRLTDNLWDTLEGNVTSVINILKVCTEAQHPCAFNEEYEKADSTMNKINETLMAHENDESKENWEAVEKCYGNLVKRIEERMSQVSLLAEECENIHNYQEILQTASLLPLTLDKFPKKGTSQNSEQCQDISQLSVQLENDIRNTKLLVKHIIQEHSEKFSKDFQKILTAQSKGHHPACYNDTIQRYQKFLSRVESNEETSCTENLILMNSTLDQMMFISLIEIQPLVYDVTSCHKKNNTCEDCNHLRNKTLSEISTLRKRLSQHGPEHLITLAEEMNSCYVKLKQRLEKELNDMENCDSNAGVSGGIPPSTLKDSLSEAGGAEIKDVEDEDSPDVYPAQEVPITATERNLRIADRLVNISDTFKEYAELLEPQIDELLEKSYDKLYNSIDVTGTILKRRMSEKIERLNFVMQLNKFHQDVKRNYYTKIKHVCLRPILELMEDMTRIYQVEIPELIEKLKNPPNGDHNAPYIEALEYVVNRLRVLSQIRGFDLKDAKFYAEECFRESKEQLCAFLKGYTRLGERTAIKFPTSFKFNSPPVYIDYPSTYVTREEEMSIHDFNEENISFTI